MYTCPKNTKHTKFHSIIMDDSIHHAKIVCSECDAFVKWASPSEISNLTSCQNDSITMGEAIEDIAQSRVCPFLAKFNETGIPCAKQACQLWWLCDHEGILAKLLAIATRGRLLMEVPDE